MRITIGGMRLIAGNSQPQLFFKTVTGSKQIKAGPPDRAIRMEAGNCTGLYYVVMIFAVAIIMVFDNLMMVRSLTFPISGCFKL